MPKQVKGKFIPNAVIDILSDNKQLSKLEAFIKIIDLAQEGNIEMSYGDIAKKLKWSKAKSYRFIRHLINKGILYETVSETKVKRITLRESAIYTASRTKSETVSETNNIRPSNKFIHIFEQARLAFPGTKRGTDTEWGNFKKKHKDYDKCVHMLLPAIKNQVKWREDLSAKGEDFIPVWKNFSTWINQRCWEEVHQIKQTGIAFGTR